MRVNVHVADSSGLSSLSVIRGRKPIAVFTLRGKATTVDTTLLLERLGESLHPDTLEIKVGDRWDNFRSLRLVVFTFRPPPDTLRDTTGNK